MGWLPLVLLFLATACNHDSGDSTSNDPLALHYKIIRKLPHDTTAFTQGLEFFKGVLYEGTGEKGESQLRKVDLATGKVLQKVDLDKAYFGEGITIFGDKIYQLTWQNHVVLQYDLSFNLLRQFTLRTEGWGMTHDSTHLIISDGSSMIYYRDPATLDSVRVINVTDGSNLVNNINELEYIHGFIYANIWQTDYIYKIDPATGNVVGKADFSNLLKHEGETVYDSNAVLNGIAYDDQTGKLYITGKYWPAMFEIQFQ
ncbi:glutaminyl-peptide cyclotransferase [Dinghuibacter silviterrae]|nr:glutaminyl-peptide cyclotransferase [Dinghuibacter silviterrae]